MTVLRQMKIQDGVDKTKLLEINASKEALVKDTDVETAIGAVETAVIDVETAVDLTTAAVNAVETNQTDKSQMTQITDGTNEPSIGTGYILGELIDENGVAYGVKHIENKPRVSSMPYLYDIAEGNVPNHFSIRKFGHNSAVGATLEEIWDGSAVYAYLTAAEQLQVVSSDVDDQGVVLSSGTATGGSTTTLIDTGATFLTDTVAAGDLVINDTEVVHGIVLTVDSEIQITVALAFRNSDPDKITSDAVPFESGDTYRVVNANDTGAAVIVLKGLDASYDVLSEYIVLNGTTDVQTVGSYLRVFRAIVIIAGVTGSNEGIISIEDNASAVLLAAIVVGNNQTAMSIWTVPAGFKAFMTQFYASTSIAKATEVSLWIRPQGEVFQLKKLLTLNANADTFPYSIPLAIAQKTDIALKALAAGGGGEVSAGFDLWYEAV